MRELERSDRTSESGIVAPLFALSLVALLGMAALVVDYGSLWQNRREMVTATDAGALAAAKEFALGGDGCAAIAAQYYNLNAPPGAAAPTCTPGAQEVTVDGSVDVTFTFGQILGIGSDAITSSTTASWEQPSSVTGLRPLGLCLSVLQGLGASPPTFDGQIVRVPWNNAQPDICSVGQAGNIPGSWGYIDFNGGGNGGNEIVQWTKDGYPGEVTIPSIFGPFTGAHNSVESPLTDLIGQCISLPIYEWASGNGNNAKFNVVDIATIEVTKVSFKGKQSDRYFEFIFKKCLVAGSGNGGGIDYGPRIIRICDVDNAPTDNCP